MSRHVSSPSMGLAPWINQMCIRVNCGSLTMQWSASAEVVKMGAGSTRTSENNYVFR